MTLPRRAHTEPEKLSLLTQVEGHCPLCADKLFHNKKNGRFKTFELAHIYPLNPTTEEEKALDGAGLLHGDRNHPDNIIPLCVGWHNRTSKQSFIALDEIEKYGADTAQFLIEHRVLRLDNENVLYIRDWRHKRAQAQQTADQL